MLTTDRRNWDCPVCMDQNLFMLPCKACLSLYLESINESVRMHDEILKAEKDAYWKQHLENVGWSRDGYHIMTGCADCKKFGPVTE